MIPRVSDLREMKENIERAQYRGTVDHFAAERLRHVIEAFEEFDATREALAGEVAGLDTTVDGLEVDVDDFRVVIDGTLDDLDLTPEQRKAIDTALKTENERQAKRLAAEVDTHLTRLRQHVEDLSDLVEGDE